MTRKQYAVHTVRDEPVRLRDQLDHIAADGGRVVSVIWQPARQLTLEPGLPPYEVASGYVVVSEHELPEAAGQLEPLHDRQRDGAPVHGTHSEELPPGRFAAVRSVDGIIEGRSWGCLFHRLAAACRPL